MTAKRKPRYLIGLFSFLNAVVMLCFTYYWLSLPYTFGDEAFLIKWSSLTKKTLFGFDKKPDPGEVLFVNVAYNKTTIDVEPYHRKVITDRAHLTEFFKLLNKHKSDVRFVLCDILFEDSTKYDAALGQELAQLGDKLMLVRHLTKKGPDIAPVFDLPSVPATYNATEGFFLKFPLTLRDTQNTVPMAMFERLNGAVLNNDGMFYWLNGNLCFPAPIVDFKVRNSDIRMGTDLGEKNFWVWELGTILESPSYMDESDVRNYFKDKIVLIGDFKDDMHLTPFGKMPGLLIIYNAYLTLVYNEYIISIGWLVFLLLAFTFISYRIFSEIRVERPAWLVKMFKSKLGQMILNSMDEVALLTLITLFSYFVFNIHINILILLIYLKVIEFIWIKIADLRKSKAVVSKSTAVS